MQGDFSKVTDWEVAALRPEMQGSVSGLPWPPEREMTLGVT